MGSIIKRQKGWGIKYDLPESTREDRKQKTISGFKTKRDAEKTLAQIEAKIATGNYFTTNNMTVGQMLDMWMTDHVELTLAPKTILFYKNYIDIYLKKYLGDIKLHDLKANHVTSFYNKLKKDNKSNGVINKCHKTLRAALYQAYRWEYTDKKIMDKVTPPRVDKVLPSFWDEKEIKLGLEYFKEHALLFHIKVALNLGLRQGEVCGLKEDDIDYENKTITISRVIQFVNNEVITKSPKTESSNRILPLSHYMINEFQQRSEWIQDNMTFMKDKYNTDWFGYFSVDETGNIIHDRKVSSRFRKAMNRKDCDLKKITFHDLRHSCASWLLFKGAGMKDIQEILGHSSMRTTSDIYSHVTLGQKRDFLNKLNDDVQEETLCD